MLIVEIDNNQLSYQVTKVIYKGKEFQAPINITTLMAWDYIIELLNK